MSLAHLTLTPWSNGRGWSLDLHADVEAIERGWFRVTLYGANNFVLAIETVKAESPRAAVEAAWGDLRRVRA